MTLLFELLYISEFLLLLCAPLKFHLMSFSVFRLLELDLSLYPQLRQEAYLLKDFFCFQKPLGATVLSVLPYLATDLDSTLCFITKKG